MAPEDTERLLEELCESNRQLAESSRQIAQSLGNIERMWIRQVEMMKRWTWWMPFGLLFFMAVLVWLVWFFLPFP